MNEKRKKILTISIVTAVVLLLTTILCLFLFDVIHIHKYGEWETVTAPACGVEGVERRSCRCGKQEENTISALEHRYNATQTPATCDSDGYTYMVCEYCSDSYVTEILLALGHEYQEWKPITLASCLQAGQQEHVCSICGKAEQGTSEKIGHNYVPVSNETVEGIDNTTYQCEYCEECITLREGETLLDITESDTLFDCSVQFTFDIVTAGTEEDIYSHLKIIDAYFNGSEYENHQDVVQAYTVTDKGDGIWTVSTVAPYEYDTTYLVKLSDDLRFAEYKGRSLVFTTEKDENHIDTYAYSENIKFLQTEGSYAPVVLAGTEDSEYLYVKVSTAEGLSVGNIVCIGNVSNVSELTAINAANCYFGKIDEIKKYTQNEYLLVLTAPDIHELFDQLDISYGELIDFENCDTEDLNAEVLSAQMVDSLYASEDYIHFLCAVNNASASYLSERNLDVTLLSNSSFIDHIRIDPNVRLQGTKIIATLRGTISIPISTKNGTEIGSISVEFNIDLESEFKLSLKYKLKWFIIPVGIKYFDLSLTQSDTIGFSFSVNLNIDYSLEENQYKYVYVTHRDKIHRESCPHLTRVVDTTKLQRITAERAEELLQDPRISGCKQCNPENGFVYDIQVLNTYRKTIHAYGCIYVDEISDENKKLSLLGAKYWMEEQGYSCCSYCRPDQIEQKDFEERLLETLEYADWGAQVEQIKGWAESAGASEHSSKGITLVHTGIPICGIISVNLDVNFVLSFQLEASMSYRYEYTHTNVYGIRLEGGRAKSYSSKTEQVLTNELNLVGRAEFKAGFEVDAYVSIVGLSKWVRAGVTAEVGIYAELAGVLNISTTENQYYAAAYFEAGVYLDVEAYYKVIVWEGRASIYSQKWALLSLGYDKAYYAFVDYPEELDIGEEYDIAESDLLKVRYYDLRKMEQGEETLNVLGVADKYTVTLTLESGEYCEIVDGVIQLKANAPCSFTDRLTITVTGDGAWHNYAKGNVAVYLNAYTVQLNISSEGIHTYDDACDTTCNLCGDTRTAPHSYAATWSHDAEQHWKACTCGAVTDQDEHNYEDACDVSCNTCGYERVAPHAYASAWSSNAETHWHACSCGAVTDSASHEYSDACDADCNICGYTRTPPHNYATAWSSDTEYHWHTCACGAETEKVAHDYDDNCDTICNICTYVRVAPHTFSGEWLTTEETHWKECVDCSQKAYEGAHVCVNAQCSTCGLSMTTEGLTYKLYGSGDSAYYSVTGIGTCTDTVIAIPELYQGVAVKSIGSWAFENCTGIVSVTIPLGVTSIGFRAFYNCSSLTSITIPTSVTSIDSNAFCDCSSLTGVYITDLAAWCDIEFGDGTKSNPLQAAKKLYLNGSEIAGDIVIPNTVTQIPQYAFYDCDLITSITIPSSVTIINYAAFRDCSSLTAVNIGENGQLTSIGEHTFDNCSSLESITIPPSVTSIGVNAFYNCTNLKAVYISDIAAWCNISYASWDYVGDSPLQYADELYLNGALVTDVVIPEGVVSIPKYAFDCSSLVSVTIPSSVKSIGINAFWRCDSLKNVYITDLTAWCNISFGNSYANPRRLAKNLYLNGDELSGDVIIADDIMQIPSFTFYQCDGITAVSIPDSVISVGANVFEGCNSLTSVTFETGSQLMSIGYSAFKDCRGLVSITIPSGVTSIGGYAFYECSSLISITIPSSVKSINTRTFNKCRNLKNVIFDTGSQLTSIEYEAFYECGSLMNITIPSGVTDIGYRAFRECSSLTSITLPAGVTSIDKEAFYECYRLVEIYNLSESLTVTKGATDNGFIGYYALDVYTSADMTSKIFIDSNGYIFYEDGATCCLIGYTGNETVLTLPDDCRGKNYEINKYAFWDCHQLISITIPPSVTSIGEKAFYCYKLVEVYNLSALTIQIGYTSNNGYVAYHALDVYTSTSSASKLHTDSDGYVFYEDGDICYLMGYTGSENALILPDNYNGKNYEIYKSAFYGCSSLISITIPSGVTSIGSYAFERCTNLRSVEIGANVTSIGDYAFHECTSLALVTFGESSQLTSIDSSAFNGCSSLETITIPSGVTNIGGGAFYFCTSLTLVTFGESSQLTSIGSSAFYGCSSLTSITIPFGVRYIDTEAFYGCSSLTSVTFETTDGWWYTSSSSATSGTSLSSADLADTSVAATYLKNSYCDYYWKRS